MTDNPHAFGTPERDFSSYYGFPKPAHSAEVDTTFAEKRHDPEQARVPDLETRATHGQATSNSSRRQTRKQRGTIRRKRSVRKEIHFNESEWKRISRNMELTRSTTFMDYARTMLINGQVIAQPETNDANPLAIVVAPLANNLNQIARNVNATGTATVPQLVAAEVTLNQIRDLVEAHLHADKASA